MKLQSLAYSDRQLTIRIKITTNYSLKIRFSLMKTANNETSDTVLTEW
jgi:hypothetical protein